MVVKDLHASVIIIKQSVSEILWLVMIWPPYSSAF